MTFENLKTQLADWLAVSTSRLSDAARGMVINLAMRDLLRDHDLRFGEYQQSIAVVADDYTFDLPTGYSRPYELYYFDTYGKVELAYLTREEFIERYGDNSEQGTPANWTTWGDQLLINRSDNSYTLYFDLYRILPDLEDGSPDNTNDFVANAWEPVFFRALWYATRYLIEDTREAAWKLLASEHERKLVREHKRARSVARRPESHEPG
jgi:hypothetical protein